MHAIVRGAVAAPLTATLFLLATAAHASGARDPGVRPGPAAAGGAYGALSADQQGFFAAAQQEFAASEGLADGLGPRFNLDSCAGCHLQPAIGGSAPAINPQVALATAFGARHELPAFVSVNGPVREARFRVLPSGGRDGGVHALFVISGRVDGGADASGCAITQDDFGANLARNNVSLRIPTPVFGTGLMEVIPAVSLVANLAAQGPLKARFGIFGHLNHNPNDGTVTRFGWKAQNATLLLFAGEAYNVEMGISNEIFATERDETSGCQFKSTPNDTTAAVMQQGAAMLSSVEKFALFMRLLAPPAPSATIPGGAASIGHGRTLFVATGCALCHTPQLVTGNATLAVLANQPVNLYSDLALHRMGARLADYVQQGGAAGDEFRTAPLWGLGQRLFLLHDGRTSDLVQAIEAHASAASPQFAASEADLVVLMYKRLADADQQDLLNFLRSL
jgi:CxxC motif-containing protein (DUF1111 family)